MREVAHNMHWHAACLRPLKDLRRKLEILNSKLGVVILPETEIRACDPLNVTSVFPGSEFIKGKGKVHPYTGTEAVYRPYGP